MTKTNYKKKVLLFYLIFFSFLALLALLPFLTGHGWAQQCSEDTQVARLSPAMIGSVPSAACNPSSDYVGINKTGYTSYTNTILDTVVYQYASATCTGTLATANVYVPGGSSGNLKICVWNASTRALVGCSAEIDTTTVADAWKTGSITGSVTAGTNNYLIGLIESAGTAYWMRLEGTGTDYWAYHEGIYAAPATHSPLEAEGTYTSESMTLSIWVSIQ